MNNNTASIDNPASVYYPKIQEEIVMRKNVFSLAVFWLTLFMLFLYKLIQQAAYITPDPQISDLVLSLVITGLTSLICYLIIGFCFIFISRTEKKRKLIIFDILLIDIPCLILVCSTLFILGKKNIVTEFLWMNRNFLTANGALFLSCEIYRYIRFFKRQG